MNDLLTQFTQSVGAFLPGFLGALGLVICAWIIASLLRVAVRRLGRATNLDARLSSSGITLALGDAVYWLVFLLFLPGILGALGVVGLLLPVQGLVNEILGFLPRLAAAALIAVIGVFVARLVRRIVSSLLASVGLDRWGARLGFGTTLGTQPLSALAGLLVYVLILLPVLTAALNALAIDAVTRPLSAVLQTVLDTIPNLLAAALVLGIAYVVGRVVATLVSGLLSGIGFDALLVRIGLYRPTPGALLTTRPAEIAGTVLLVAIMVFAAVEALQLLGLIALAAMLSAFIVLATQIGLGLAIFALGLLLANMAARAILSSGMAQARLLALTARVAILVLSAAMALRQIGLANEIITLAFGLTLGAIAVAAALAFGLGGRESAGRIVEQWRRRLSKEPEVPIVLPE